MWWSKGQKKFQNHSLRSSPTSIHKPCAAEFCLYLSLIPHRAFLRLTEKRGNGKVWCGLELDKCLFITMLHHFFSNCLVTMTAQGPPGSSHLFSPVLPTSRAYVYFFPLFPNWMLSEARECGLLVQGNFKQWMIGEMSKYCPQNGPKA